MEIEFGLLKFAVGKIHYGRNYSGVFGNVRKYVHFIIKLLYRPYGLKFECFIYLRLRREEK